MAVESVTVVAPEVQVGPFLLSKGICTYSCDTDGVVLHVFRSDSAFLVFRPCGADQQIPDSEFEGFSCGPFSFYL